MKSVLTVFLLSIVSLTSWGQELNCEVTVNTDNIPSSDRDYLRNFKSDVERYLNNTRFTNADLYGEKVQASMSIFFTQVTGSNRYRAEVVVGSTRPIYVGNDKSDKVTQVVRIKDTQWEFTYVPNQRIYFDEFSFDPLTDFLDYYAFLIIGFDLETYKPMDGNTVFQKALNTANAALATSFASDWQSTQGFSRFGLAEELNNPRYQPVRQAYTTYHFDGIDLLATENRKALENILGAIESISKVRNQYPMSLLTKMIFGAKYKEIADVFSNYGDGSVYDKLASYDPEHRAEYMGSKNRQQ